MRCGFRAWMGCGMLTMLAAAPARAEVKVLLCTGDYGMWAQERAALIAGAVAKAAPGEASFEVEQSFNFVRKLEAPGYAERFDVIACGDLALGQITTRAQEAMVRFVHGGGGLVYVVQSKSYIPFYGDREVEPLPLADILPYKYPATDPRAEARDGSRALPHTDPLFAGLDFAGTPLLAPGKDGKVPDPVPLLALERPHGKGRVIALYGAFGATYRYVSYAKHEKNPGGWEEWDGLGGLWMRLLTRAAAASPVLAETRAALDGRVREVPCAAEVTVDATRPVDDLRAAVFSIVALQQLYNEDGGAGEDQFLALNPRDWFDRRTQEVLGNDRGKYPDKPAMLREFNIRGIIMGNNSYGSYGGWDAATWTREVQSYVEAARKHPDILAFFQPGNEPPCDQGYFDFHNRLCTAVLKEAPDLKVIGPGKAWNCHGVNAGEMRAFIEACGKSTDILNWHIYARCPSSVRDEVLYWTKQAEGKLRSPGPVRVMFTEADAWNTRDSQFNYLLDRAFTFLPEPEIIATFQYCMRPRYEGGTYLFGVLFPGHKRGDEFMANYNGYWIFRNLRGKLVETTADVVPAAAAENCRALASVSKDGRTVTLVAHYDTGYVGVGEKSTAATFKAKVKLPAGRYELERSDSTWIDRKVAPIPGEAAGEATVEATLTPATAVAWTWRRK